MIRLEKNPVQPRTYNRPLFWMAVLAAAATFPLIFIGGLVTSHGAGMSVPDWPNSYGYNMFTFPPSKWLGGIFYEHTHRLIGSAVGFMTLIVTVLAFATDKRRWVRWTAVALLFAVGIQGTLGGLRVVLNQLDLAIVHGIAGQIFFCFIATFCVMISPLWTQPRNWTQDERHHLASLKKLAAVTASVIVLQLIVGAIMRHSGAGLAIPDFPASYGHILPPTTLTPEFRQTQTQHFGPIYGIRQVTLFQIWIHFAHRIGALLVTLAISSLCILIFIRHRHRPLLYAAITLLVLLATQLTLGILTVLWQKPADIASFHVAVGALTLMLAWITFIQIHGMLRPQMQNVPARGFPVEDVGLLRNRIAVQ